MSQGEFAGGWKVLTAALVGNALSAGTLATYSIGILGPSLAREFHWGSGAVNSGYLMLAVATLAAAPFAGMLADRIGVRRVALGSALILAPTYMLFALLHGSLPVYLGLWAAVAVLGSGTMPLTWSRALNNRFEIYKGLALGISLLGTAVSGSLLKPYMFALVDHGGWRLGFIGLGLMPLVSFAVAWFLFFDKPAGAANKQAGTTEIATAYPGLSFAEAVHTGRFWILFTAVALAAAGISGALPNMESLLKSKGFGTADVRSMVPFIGLALGVGRIGSSFLIDRIWAPLVACAMLLIAAAVFASFSGGATSTGAAWAMVLVVGMTAGMEADIAAFLAARYFGARNYSSIYGFIYGAFAFGAGVGALSYGIAVDKLGNYELALMTSAGLLTLSGLLLVCLGRYAFPKPAAILPGGLRIA